MRNFSIIFGIIFSSCIGVVSFLSQPANVKGFKQLTFRDIVLHEKILPNLLVFIILLWIFIWLIIPKEVKKLRIEPLFKLNAKKHLIASFLIFSGVILEYLIIVLPQSIRVSRNFPFESLIIIIVLLVWWLATIIYGNLPDDYKNSILFILSFTMILLTIIQSLTYFIKL